MSDHVYKSIEVTGSSTTDVSDAVKRAVAKAAETSVTSTGSRSSRSAGTSRTTPSLTSRSP